MLDAERSNRSGCVPRAEQGCDWLRRSLTRLLKGKVEVRLPRTWGGVFRNDYDHRDFCAIGASAGAQRSVLYLLRAVPAYQTLGGKCQSHTHVQHSVAPKARSTQ